MLTKETHTATRILRSSIAFLRLPPLVTRGFISLRFDGFCQADQASQSAARSHWRTNLLSLKPGKGDGPVTMGWKTTADCFWANLTLKNYFIRGRGHLGWGTNLQPAVVILNPLRVDMAWGKSAD
jgi:hypothetical protein